MSSGTKQKINHITAIHPLEIVLPLIYPSFSKNRTRKDFCNNFEEVKQCIPSEGKLLFISKCEEGKKI